MEFVEDIDQFDLLEQKIESLIERIATLKREKESFVEKAQIQDEKISDLTDEVTQLKTARDNAKQRIVSLLEKIEQINL